MQCVYSIHAFVSTYKIVLIEMVVSYVQYTCMHDIQCMYTM